METMTKHTFKNRFSQNLRMSVNHSNSGQIIVFMAFGMIILLAALGLAIDGGRLVYLKRDAQNAVDAAVVAATYSLCAGNNGTAVEEAGYLAATDNGFTTDSSTTVAVNSPPQNTTSPGYNNPQHVEVSIESKIPSFFIQLVYGGELGATAYGVGNCNPGFDPATYNAAIMNFCNGCSDGIDFNGSQGNPSMITGSLVSNCDVNISSSGVITKSVDFLDGYTFSGNNTMTIVEGTSTFPTAISYPPLFDLADYAPGGEKAIAAGSDYHSYTTDQSFGNGSILNGLYYFSESVGDVSFNHVAVGPDGMSLVFAATDATITFSGSTDLTAYVDHILILSMGEQSGCSTATSGPGVIKMSGFTQWEGLFYAPGSYVSLPGNEVHGTGAIIANTVDIPISSGTLTYDPTVLPRIPPSIDIAE